MPIMTEKLTVGGRDLEVVKRLSDRQGVTVDIVKHRKDKRYHVILVCDGDQHLFETSPVDETSRQRALYYADGYRAGKSIWKT
jgi:hypothetical protein